MYMYIPCFYYICFVFFIFEVIYLFYSICLRWIFTASCRLSLVVAVRATLSCGARVSHCGGSSFCGVTGSRAHGLQ